MFKMAQEEGWFKTKTLRRAVEKIQIFVGFPYGSHWDCPKEFKYGENACLMNTNKNWDRLKKTGKAQGICIDHAYFLGSLAQSMGIPVVYFAAGYRTSDGKGGGHEACLFFDGDKWFATNKEVKNFKAMLEKRKELNLNVYRIPWKQAKYLTDWTAGVGIHYIDSAAYYNQSLTSADKISEFGEGIPSKIIRKWLGLD